MFVGILKCCPYYRRNSWNWVQRDLKVILHAFYNRQTAGEKTTNEKNEVRHGCILSQPYSPVLSNK